MVPGQPYTIPAGNPFIGNPAFRDEIWALGLRNPYRFSFDRVTGDLLIADVGQSALEEVNFQAANAGGGQNYGWRLMEGNQCFNPGAGCESSDFTMPAFQYQNAGARGSIIGGYRYRGSVNPALQGSYIVGDFCSGEILAARLESNQQWAQEVLLDTALMISSFAEDDNGALLVVDLNGTVYRLLAPLAIWPASGTYLTSQSIDLAVILASQQAAVTGYAVALNGQGVSSALDSCGIVAVVAGDGISLRCPDIPLSSLGAGSHTLRVELQFNNGSVLRSSATWQILEVVN